MPEAPHTIGYLAQVACTWEVLARKAGNVCPGREFPDLTVNDFLLSAAAIAPVLDQAPHQPLGVTILRCIEATRTVVRTNTNLGIVLLLAPLASVPLDQPLQPGLSALLARTTVEDSRNVFAAIRLAMPGGLGEAAEQDVRDEPTLPLRAIMALAKNRDLIATEYAFDFGHLMNVLPKKLEWIVAQRKNAERALVELHLWQLSRYLDSLIVRKQGEPEASRVKRAAARVLSYGSIDTPAGAQAFREFDAFLRADNHARNPGTSADLSAAALYVGLRDKLISVTMPFMWDGHPFEVP